MAGTAKAAITPAATMGQLLIPEVFISDLFAALLAEQAAGPRDKDGDHDDEGVGVAEVGRDVAGTEGFDEAKKQTADHRARQIAEAADDADDESFQAETSPHGRFGEENRRDQQSRDTRQDGAEGESDRNGAVHGNSDQARGVQVLRGRLHQDSESGLGQEEELQEQDRGQRGEDEELMHRNDDAGETQRWTLDRGWERHRQRAPNDQRQVF